jgi:uncharacterized protein
MTQFYGIPELMESDLVVRIPTTENITLTRRVEKIVDSEYFQRLRKVRQLSLTHLVYPGATHTRFEHSLGVYQLIRRYLNHMLGLPLFRDFVRPDHVLAVILAALLHDVGHYPFCHIVEGLIPDMPKHEERGQEIVNSLFMSDLIEHFDVDPKLVGKLISGDTQGLNDSELVPFRFLRDLIDSPVDADKMDYLERDSIHCGVTYGHSYDKNRLIGSLALSDDFRLALTDKGRSSAEFVIFSRYVMLTEVYWHHTVRAASIMLIRALQEAQNIYGWTVFLSRLMDDFGDDDALSYLSELVAGDPDISGLVRGLRTRDLYKRVRTYSPLDPDSAGVFESLKGFSGPQDGIRLSQVLEGMLGLPRMTVLADIVPIKSKSADINVYYPRRNQYRNLTQVSPVANVISATWGSMTGIVRIYCHPKYEEKLVKIGDQIDNFVMSAATQIKWGVVS